MPPMSQNNLLTFDAALVDAIREDVSVLTLLAEVLCLLDMIVNSFAHTISTKPVDRYIRPEFTGTAFDISACIYVRVAVDECLILSCYC